MQGISKTKLKNYDVEEQVDAIVADNRTKAGWPHVVATLVAELPPEARPSDNALETLRKLYKKACDAIGDEEMYSLIRLAYQAGHTNPDVMSDPEK